MPDPENKGAADGGDLKELRALLLELKEQGVSVNEGLAEKNRELIGKLKEARRNAASPGDLILKGEDAEAWKAYQELGDPKEIRKALESATKAEATLADIREAEVHQQAARLAKFRPSAFAKFAKAAGIKVVIEPHPKERDKDGEPIMVPYVKGEGDQKTPLDKFAEQNWADDLDLLKEGEVRAGTPPPGRRAAMPPPTGDEPDELRQDMLRAGVGAF